MNKSSLFIAAGAAAILCGCSTPVASNKPVIPAPPVDDPAPVAVTEPAVQPAETQVKQRPVQAPAFEPLTDAISSGGVDSAPRKGKKAIKNSNAGKVAAAGGTYVVKSGDTPERIARKHGVRLSALMAANNLTQQSARRLQVGQKLTIPGRNAQAAVSGSKKAVKKSTGTVASAAAGADGKYVVQSGDSPERIARKLRVRLSDLLKANNLDQQSARRLQIGQKLVIPGKEAAPEVKPQVTKDPEVIVQPNTNDSEVIIPPVTQPDNNTAVTGNTVVEQPAATGTVDAVDAESEIEMRTIEENTTAAELAAKYNVSAEIISEKNSGKTEFAKGDLIFIPKK